MPSKSKHTHNNILGEDPYCWKNQLKVELNSPKVYYSLKELITGVEELCKTKLIKTPDYSFSNNHQLFFNSSFSSEVPKRNNNNSRRTKRSKENAQFLTMN